MVPAANEVQLAQDKIIAEWKSSGVGAKQLAARLALECRAASKGTLLESSMQIASRLGTGNSMAARARKLLADMGIITRSADRHYYVA
jgi:hypothetical protein